MDQCLCNTATGQNAPKNQTSRGRKGWEMPLLGIGFCSAHSMSLVFSFVFFLFQFNAAVATEWCLYFGLISKVQREREPNQIEHCHFSTFPTKLKQIPGTILMWNGGQGLFTPSLQHADLNQQTHALCVVVPRHLPPLHEFKCFYVFGPSTLTSSRYIYLETRYQVPEWKQKSRGEDCVCCVLRSHKTSGLSWT